MLVNKLKTSVFLLSSLLASKALGAWQMGGDILCHDPSIIQEGDRWYTFCTGEGIQVLTTGDGGDTWVRAPQIFLNKVGWWSSAVPGQSGIDVWAPDVEVFNNRVYLFYSISTFGSQVSAIGLATASSIGAGSWTDEGAVLTSTTGDAYNAIDPNMVIDQSGKPWLAFGSFWTGLKIVALDPSTMRPTGDIYSIAALNPIIYTSTLNGKAASITYHDGYYYLFASIDKCCSGLSSTYKIVISRSQNINGPYVDKDGNSALETGGSLFDVGNERWIGPGGEDVSNGVLARHAYDADDNGVAKLLVSPLNWANGWPTY
ncbi:protein AbnA [Phascolomyces articulosus]|uniref:Arabinan endo-1,5-alpha-L-arabinosidase n=1 Tax=Phascolomyces articulosus TaxID=60185 RepID=A0AAD5PG79_9FUNG|nr:protein AbnA [Phascolomyces articulosus]